jgi:hypothetical protein
MRIRPRLQSTPTPTSHQRSRYRPQRRICRDGLIDFAHNERVAILAPLFPAGIYSYNDLNNCKLLKYKAMRFDLMLQDMLNEVALR